ncbi:hypothetical protein STEG23_027741, partial [Scotinomys teguina]
GCEWERFIQTINRPGHRRIFSFRLQTIILIPSRECALLFGLEKSHSGALK